MNPVEIISKFDQFLHRKSKSFEAVVIGGTALNLLGVIERETRDCDILDPKIPEDIKKLSIEFAETLKDEDLKQDWLNNGPASLLRDLDTTWKNQTEILFSGLALTLYTLSRIDLIKSKVFALCDRTIDKPDCIALKPNKNELLEILPWLEQRDANPMWPEHVREVLSNLAKELGYEL
ncbi:MAG TPA: DUF6036 family nucleotidyltransferase [Oligoflexia bacterium]|nr:DUF6036 family nucleotidyltransferase [Oligoflexia bacterium]